MVQLFVDRFWFGCEADDPVTVHAFDRRANPFGAALRAVFGSDNGHWDVPDMAGVVAEAWELVEHDVMGADDFRDFMFANPVRLHAGMNAEFFTGTRIEQAVKAELVGSRRRRPINFSRGSSVRSRSNRWNGRRRHGCTRPACRCGGARWPHREHCGSRRRSANRPATVDADGLIVAPGFVDIHTHLDAQVFWDPWLTPTSLHGITTVVGGNCGFSIAPLTDADGDYVMRMLARVEGMPLESLRIGVPWGWSSTSEYLDAVDRARPALNMAFMAGHSTMRRVGDG